MILRAAFVGIGCVATGLSWSAGGARANDVLFGQEYGSRAVEPCESFGEDLDAVVGSGSCVRFGGRVRVDLGALTQPRAGDSYGAAPAAIRVEEGSDRPASGVDDSLGRIESVVPRRHLRVPSHDTTGTIDPASAR